MKNLLTEAREQLERRGMRSVAARDFVGRVNQLTQEIDFWRNQSRGLALFLTPEEVLLYRLPVDFEEVVNVGRQAYVKPLVALLGADRRYYVLTVSQKGARLYEGTRYGLSAISDDLLGGGLDELLANEDRRKKYPQIHSFHAERGPRERGDSIFHGHAGGEEDVKKDLDRYLHEVDEVVNRRLGNGAVPLVFAGVEETFAMYKGLTRYAHLVEQAVEGNPDLMPEDELHKKAYEVVLPWLDRQRQQAVANYQRLGGTARTVSTISDVALAAAEGSVDTLLLNLAAEQWGTIDRQNRQVVLHQKPEDNDVELFNSAVVHALANHGEVFGLAKDEMPEGHVAVALLRYDFVPPAPNSAKAEN